MISRWIVLSGKRANDVARVAALLSQELAGSSKVLLWDMDEILTQPGKSIAEVVSYHGLLSSELLRNLLMVGDESVAHLKGPLSIDEQILTWIKNSFEYILAISTTESSLLASLDHAHLALLTHRMPDDNIDDVDVYRQRLARRNLPQALARVVRMTDFTRADSSDEILFAKEVDPIATLADDKELTGIRPFARQLQSNSDFYITKESLPTENTSIAKERIHQRLIDMTVQAGDKQPEETQATIQTLLSEELEISGSRQIRDKVYHELVNEILGLGCLDPLLQDSGISEIMVSGTRPIFVERNGRLYPTDVCFKNETQLRTVIDRIVAPLGRRVDESNPFCDARLTDGSRVNIVLPPLALDGPSLTIRKFMNRSMTLDNLLKWGTLSQGMADLLVRCVRDRKNIIISGGTGSGKTTLLNMLSGFIPSDERIITIEDAAELRLQQPHVIRLESRCANMEGQGAIPIRRLVINALRMRPDRIVIGECRGGEALDMLQAMNTGHDGSLSTLHANSPRDALGRLETLVLMSGIDLPVRVVREQIKSAIDIIIQISRQTDGSRKVTAIHQLTGMEGEILSLCELFREEKGQFHKSGVLQ